MRSQTEKAQEFRALHDRKRTLVLPNAWDVPSARVFEDEGFPAVATSSAGLMVSLGYQDGQEMGIDELASAVGRIARVLSIPLSADAVAGFGETPSEVARAVGKLVAAGAIGVNIEDFVHATKSMLPLESQLGKLRALKDLQKSSGIPFVINARTDAFRFAPGEQDARLDEAIRRGIAFRDAGADCVYPMGLVDSGSIAAYVQALDFPINVMVRKGLPPVAELQRLGVARVSFGPSASYAAMGLLRRASREVQEKGTYESLTEGAIGFDELNSLAVPRRDE
jgi:2-methylisocitrate lyase-like PEP mutase family enzyme